MKPVSARCLILACGNTLREDDGVGPFLAAQAEQRFADSDSVRVISRHQWTPELAEDITGAESVLFIDCAANAQPGSVQLSPVEPGSETPGLATHHFGAAELLSLTRELYGNLPRISLLLTIGAGSLELREGFSEPVSASLPGAWQLVERTVLQLLKSSPGSAT
jgi:hydrogenase maturation protease